MTRSNRRFGMGLPTSAFPRPTGALVAAFALGLAILAGSPILALVLAPAALWGVYYTFNASSLEFYTELFPDHLLIHGTRTTCIDYSNIASIERGKYDPTRKSFEELAGAWGRLFGSRGGSADVESWIRIRTKKPVWSSILFIPTYVRVRKVMVEELEEFIRELTARLRSQDDVAT